MPTQVTGAVELRKALKKFTPDLAKETQKELGTILKPITNKARGFIPSTSPLSGWANQGTGAWERIEWSSLEAIASSSSRIDFLTFRRATSLAICNF